MVRYKHIALHVLLLRSPPQREYFFLVVVKHSNSTPDYYCSIILLRAPFNGNKPGAAGNAFLISPTVLASTHPQRRLHINSVGQQRGRGVLETHQHHYKEWKRGESPLQWNFLVAGFGHGAGWWLTININKTHRIRQQKREGLISSAPFASNLLPPSVSIILFLSFRPNFCFLRKGVRFVFHLYRVII